MLAGLATRRRLVQNHGGGTETFLARPFRFREPVPTMRPPRLLALLFLIFSVAAPAEEVFSPVQTAYLQAETRKADERFVADVARITASPVALVRRAMPREGRITDPAVRVIAAIEAQRHIVVSPEQKALISSAEQQRRSAIANARAAARQR